MSDLCLPDEHRDLYIRYDLYMTDTSSFGVSEARRQLSWIVERARSDHAPIYLERHGRRIAAVIDADDLDALIALSEDMADIRAAQESRDQMAKTGALPIPWDQVKADLGLT
jgi:prevent-host-death family protein